MVRQTSKWGQIFLLSLVGLGATAFATAWFYRIDEVITVPGRLVPERGGVEVKSPLSGQLNEVLVKGGEEVKKGDVLLKFDVQAAKVQETTFSRQLSLEKKRLEDQLNGNMTRQNTLKRNIALRQQIQDRLIPLKEAGAISEIQVLQQANQLETQQDELIQLQNRREELINDGKSRQVERGKQEQVRERLRNEIVRAPISGTVFDLKPDNDRYVAMNAESLLKIVPKGALSGEVNIENSDIGFIRKGQKVKVRIDSFPHTEYGEIKGTIRSIGADALPPNDIIRSYHFPLDLKLDRSNLKTKDGTIIPLQSGMTITTNLKLRDRRLIELLSDLFTNRGESLQRLRQP